MNELVGLGEHVAVLDKLTWKMLLYLPVTPGLLVHRSPPVMVAIVIEGDWLSPRCGGVVGASWWCFPSPLTHPGAFSNTKMLCFSLWMKKKRTLSYFEKKVGGLLNMEMVFYLLFPFLPWRDWPFTLNLEDRMKRETKERARSLRTWLENEDPNELHLGSEFSASIL